MNGDPRCQRCGVALTGQALGKLCANCLLKLALESPTEPTAISNELEPAPAQPTRIRYFGDYELMEEIARGGMGVVYKARQVSLNRIVALKMILAGDFSSPAMVERFQTEAEAAARLEHPGIVPIYEIGAHEGRRYFSMRFLDGGTLTAAMSRQKFIPRRAAELMVKVAQAVHHAHQRGILHRDLKPGNILIDQAGEPHVADFGLAKVLEHDSSLTVSGAVMGTPSYMAPEQAAGETKQLSTAADVYSLGAILYELLAGRAPFRGATPAEIMRQVMEHEPERPSLLHAMVDRDLETICLKCLEKDPARRYGSAEALAEDLQCWLAHKPIQARPVTPMERAWKWARRKPVVASLIITVICVGLVGFAGVLWQFNRANDAASRATTEAKRANAEAVNARRESSRAEQELWNANFNEARAVRIAGGTGARVRSSALLKKLSHHPSLTATQTLALREEAIAQMGLIDFALPTNWISKSAGTWAWNGRLDRFVRGTRSNRVEVCEFPSERVVASFLGPLKSTFQEAAFTLDDRFLAVRFNNTGGEVRVWSLETHELLFQTRGDQIKAAPDSRSLLLLTTNGVAIHSLTPDSQPRYLQPGRFPRLALFSPDAKQLAVLPGDIRDTVEIWDAGSGAIRCSFQTSFNPHRAAWHPDGTRLIVGGDRGRLEMRTLSRERLGTNCANEPFPLKGHVGYIDHIMFAPDGSTAITYSWDYSSIVWDMVSGQPLVREERMIIGGINTAGDRAIGLRDPPLSESVVTLMHRTGYRTVAWAGEPRAAHGVWLSPDGRLAAVTYDRTGSTASEECFVWDFSRGLRVARLKGMWAQFSGDSRKLFVFEGPDESRVRSYDVSPERLADSAILPGDGTVLYEGRALGTVNTGTIARDMLVIAATGSVIFVDTLGRQEPQSWIMSAHSVAVSDNGKYIAVAHHNTPTVLRAASTGRAILTGGVNSVMKFSPDNRWLAVASSSQVQLYELDSLRPAYQPIPIEVGHSSSPPIEFSPDSLTLAIGHNRKQVCLYEASSGRELATLTPPNLAQILGSQSLKFSADGQWLAVAKNDGETIAWNLQLVRAELAKLGLDRNLAAATNSSGVINRVRTDPVIGVSARRRDRDPATPPELIDLSRYYNVNLTESWHPAGSAGGTSDLAELPQGIQLLAGVRFDVRGLIQVGSRSRLGRSYPKKVTGIAVERQCQRLHFLHSAINALKVGAGTKIGNYLVHYANGQSREIPIVLGQDVVDWFSEPGENPNPMVIAWTGDNEHSRFKGCKVRLYKSTWQNPLPDEVIRAIDFEVSPGTAQPFLVAITTE